MRKITIEIVEGKGYTVREGDRYHDELCWDEMLGQVTELTHPKLGEGRYDMRTEAEWDAWHRSMRPQPQRAPEDAPALLLTHQQQ